jgi:hypothetical protein
VALHSPTINQKAACGRSAIAGAIKCKRNRNQAFRTGRVSDWQEPQQTRGRVVHFEGNNSIPQQGFSTGDIMWAVGIWSVILTLSPVVVFYVLMVA